MLVIAGTKDPLIYHARNAKELSAYCKRVRGTGKLTWASVAGMGHYAAIWWPGVRDTLSKFLSIEPIAVTRRKPEGVAFPDLGHGGPEKYRTATNPKAIAADAKGTWTWQLGAESKLDAEEMALFDCDEQAGFNAFQDASHQHACALVDVNGKRLLK